MDTEKNTENKQAVKTIVQLENATIFPAVLCYTMCDSFICFITIVELKT